MPDPPFLFDFSKVYFNESIYNLNAFFNLNVSVEKLSGVSSNFLTGFYITKAINSFLSP